MKKLQLLTTLIKRTPKFSGCGYYALPKTRQELDEIRGSFTRVNKLPKVRLKDQDEMVKYYKNKFKD